METISKINSLVPRLTEKNYNEWNRNIRAVLRKNKLWKYTQSEFSKAEQKDRPPQSEWNEKATEAADMMTPTISAGIQAKLTEDHFNDGYKMFSRLKELLQPTGETQFMRLTREYYTLDYRDFHNISEFLDHIKLLEEQIDATKVAMTDDKRTLLCLTMALWNENHFRSLVQIWGVTSDMTAEKAREMLLEDERREASNNGDQPIPSKSTALVHRNSDKRGQEAGGCQHCHKPGHKESACWKKHPELIPAWVQLKRQIESQQPAATSGPPKTAAVVLNHVTC